MHIYIEICLIDNMNAYTIASIDVHKVDSKKTRRTRAKPLDVAECYTQIVSGTLVYLLCSWWFLHTCRYHSVRGLVPHWLQVPASIISRPLWYQGVTWPKSCAPAAWSRTPRLLRRFSRALTTSSTWCNMVLGDVGLGCVRALRSQSQDSPSKFWFSLEGYSNKHEHLLRLI